MKKILVLAVVCVILICGLIYGLKTFTAKQPINNQAVASDATKNQSLDNVLILAEKSPFALLNGEKITSPPIIKQNNNTLLPVRSVAQLLGGEINWNEKENMVTVQLNGHNVLMPIGKNELIVDGETKKISTGAEISQGVAYLPIRPLCESLNKQVNYVKLKNTPALIYIYDQPNRSFEYGPALSLFLNQKIAYADDNNIFYSNNQGEICFADGTPVKNHKYDGTQQGWYEFPKQNYLIVSSGAAIGTWEDIYAIYPDQTMKYIWGTHMPYNLTFDKTGEYLYFLQTIWGDYVIDPETRGSYDGNLFGVHLYQEGNKKIEAYPLGMPKFAYGYRAYGAKSENQIDALNDAVPMELTEKGLLIYGIEYLPDMTNWQENAGLFLVDLQGRNHTKVK